MYLDPIDDIFWRWGIRRQLALTNSRQIYLEMERNANPMACSQIRAPFGDAVPQNHQGRVYSRVESAAIQPTVGCTIHLLLTLWNCPSYRENSHCPDKIDHSRSAGRYSVPEGLAFAGYLDVERICLPL